MARQLFRSQRNKKIGGVCGGLAEYFDIDPVLVRVAFIIITLAWGFGLLMYIILWIIVPLAALDYEPAREEKSEPEGAIEEDKCCNGGNHRGKAIAGIVLIALGVLILMENVFTYFHFMHTWPILLIIIGVLILVLNTKKSHK